ncbi:hypothetical protein AVEN_50061-1, partial [Araneus ventricosus]
MTKHRYE